MNILISDANILLCRALVAYLRQCRPSWKIMWGDDVPASSAPDMIIARDESAARGGGKFLAYTGQSGRRLLYEIEKKHGTPAQAYHAATFQSLTAREREVLLHLGEGASNKDIARALHLQVATVKLHVRGICRKLGVSNRIRAALMAQYLSLH